VCQDTHHVRQDTHHVCRDTHHSVYSCLGSVGGLATTCHLAMLYRASYRTFGLQGETFVLGNASNTLLPTLNVAVPV